MTEKNKSTMISDFARPKGEGVAASQQFLGGKGIPPGPGSMLQQPKPEKPENDAPPPKTDEELLDEVDALDQDIDALEKSPELTYEERLARVGITLKEAEGIVDALMVDNEYRRTYKLTKKHSVTFRTLSLNAQNSALMELERLRPQFPTTVASIIAQYNVANALVEFRGIDFTKMADDDRLEWVRALPESVARALAEKLSEFEKMVKAVMSDGALENF